MRSGWRLLLLAMLLASCTPVVEPEPEGGEIDAFLDNLTVPNSRSFLLGSTPWPFAFTEEAQAYTYETLQSNVDLITHHLDDGVPWQESLTGTEFHPSVRANPNRRYQEAQAFDKVYVSVTPMNQDRRGLAGQWGEDSNGPLPAEWQNRTFADDKVIEAYFNYCVRIISHLNPDYFAYGIEVNGGFGPASAEIQTLRVLAGSVYNRLKLKYPDLPIFLTFQTGSWEVTWDQQLAVIKSLLPYSDYMALSTYPMMVPGEPIPDQATIGHLPKSWFRDMAALAPDKPFAIAETGYIAERLSLPSVGVDIQGSELWQAEYVAWMLDEANRLDAEFVVWFVVRDYDQGYETMRQLGFPEWTKVWRDTGLYDGRGDPRAAQRVWSRWFQLDKDE